MPQDPNEVLAIYLDAKPGGGCSPIGGEERLRHAYPRDFESAASLIRRYLNGPDFPPSQWSSPDLATASDEYRRMLELAYPELTPTVARALANRWAYDWR